MGAYNAPQKPASPRDGNYGGLTMPPTFGGYANNPSQPTASPVNMRNETPPGAQVLGGLTNKAAQTDQKTLLGQ